MATQIAPAVPVIPPATLVKVNPSVPASSNPATGSIHLPINQSAGTAVAAETKVSGNLYLVPSGKTLTGFATLVVRGTSGTVLIEDASAVVIHEVAPGSAGGPFQVPFSSAGGGGGNQLSVVITGGATLVSASVAGYYV